MNRFDLLREKLQVIIGWIENSDSKVSILLGIEGITLGWTLNQGSELRAFFASLGSMQRCLGLLLIAWFLFFSARSLWCIYGAIHPRLDLPVAVKKSLFFFGTVARLSLDDYKQRMRALKDEEILDELTEQIWVNARIAHAKHLAVQSSVTSFFLSILGLVGLLGWKIARG